MPISDADASTPVLSPRGGETRERLLDAAERLFSERGFEGTPMRALARAAGASLSSTHYHFGTKEALLEAVLHRRIGPLNALRLARLDAAEAASPASSPLPVDVILDAFLCPLFEMSAVDGAKGVRPAWSAARLFFDPAPSVSRIRAELQSEIDRRFLAALERTFPDRERHEIEIAYRLTHGLLIQFAAGVVARDESRPPYEGGYEQVLQGLLDYASAGLRSLESCDSGDAPGATR